MIQYKNMKMQVELKSSDKFTQSENKSEQIKKNSHNNNFFKTKSEVFSTLNLLKFLKSIFCASPADPNPRAPHSPGSGPKFLSNKDPNSNPAGWFKIPSRKNGTAEQQMKRWVQM